MVKNKGQIEAQLKTIAEQKGFEIVKPVNDEAIDIQRLECYCKKHSVDLIHISEDDLNHNKAFVYNNIKQTIKERTENA